MTKISVIIPCLDIKKTINGCLNSINIQKFKTIKPDIEVICVVDGNYEDLKFIKKWKKNNSGNINFKLKTFFLKKNYGAGYARNYGFKKSKGDFIAFLDDDDIWNDKKLEIQLNWHLKNPKKILSTHFYSNYNDFVNKRMYSLKEITYRNLLIGGVRVATPTILIKRKLWLGEPETQRYCEDWLMVAMVASKQNICIIPKVLAYRSKSALPIEKDKFSLSNHKFKLRFGKMQALFILYKRKKISSYALLFLLIIQFLLLLKSSFKVKIRRFI